jgi:hypothetical protein
MSNAVIEGAPHTSVAGGASGPIREMLAKARPVGAKRKRNALAGKIVPLDPQMAAGAAVDFPGARVVLADGHRAVA